MGLDLVTRLTRANKEIQVASSLRNFGDDAVSVLLEWQLFRAVSTL